MRFGAVCDPIARGSVSTVDIVPRIPSGYGTDPRGGPTMELSEVMRTAGAVREFTDEPISHAVLHDILDDARFAPSGGNRQGWKVVVVEDRAIRRQLADLCGPVYGEYTAQG